MSRVPKKYKQKEWSKFSWEVQEKLCEKFDITIPDYKTRNEKILSTLNKIDITQKEGQQNFEKGVLKVEKGFEKVDKFFKQLDEAFEKAGKDIGKDLKLNKNTSVKSDMGFGTKFFKGTRDFKKGAKREFGGLDAGVDNILGKPKSKKKKSKSRNQSVTIRIVTGTQKPKKKKMKNIFDFP